MSDRDLYVEPSALIRMSGPYQDTADHFESLRLRAEGLRLRYREAWGNDDLGNQVGPQFMGMLESIEGHAASVHADLSHHAKGLHVTGKLYAGAENDADRTARSLNEALMEEPASEPVTGFLSTESGGATGGFAPTPASAPSPFLSAAQDGIPADQDSTSEGFTPTPATAPSPFLSAAQDGMSPA